MDLTFDQYLVSVKTSLPVMLSMQLGIQDNRVSAPLTEAKRQSLTEVPPPSSTSNPLQFYSSCSFSKSLLCSSDWLRYFVLECKLRQQTLFSCHSLRTTGALWNKQEWVLTVCKGLWGYIFKQLNSKVLLNGTSGAYRITPQNILPPKVLLVIRTTHTHTHRHT